MAPTAGGLGYTGRVNESGPGAGALTPGSSRGLTADKERLMVDSTPPKPRVYCDRTHKRPWIADCPCGFLWRSRWWDVTLRMALHHTHYQVA